MKTFGVGIGPSDSVARISQQITDDAGFRPERLSPMTVATVAAMSDKLLILLSGAPVRIKLRTRMSLKYRYKSAAM
jgi:molybdopterin biosynthesis enzyme